MMLVVPKYLINRRYTELYLSLSIAQENISKESLFKEWPRTFEVMLG